MYDKCVGDGKYEKESGTGIGSGSQEDPGQPHGEEWRVSQRNNELTGSLVIGQDIGNKLTHRTDKAGTEMRGSTGKENGISAWSQRWETEEHTGRDETGRIKDRKNKQKGYSGNQ